MSSGSAFPALDVARQIVQPALSDQGSRLDEVDPRAADWYLKLAFVAHRAQVGVIHAVLQLPDAGLPLGGICY